jgi:hypothetical protein
VGQPCFVRANGLTISWKNVSAVNNDEHDRKDHGTIESINMILQDKVYS